MGKTWRIMASSVKREKHDCTAGNFSECNYFCVSMSVNCQLTYSQIHTRKFRGYNFCMYSCDGEVIEICTTQEFPSVRYLHCILVMQFGRSNVIILFYAPVLIVFYHRSLNSLKYKACKSMEVYSIVSFNIPFATNFP